MNDGMSDGMNDGSPVERDVLVDALAVHRRRSRVLRRRVTIAEATLGSLLALAAATIASAALLGSLTGPLQGGGSFGAWTVALIPGWLGWALGRGIIASAFAGRLLDHRRRLAEAESRLRAHDRAARR